MGYFVGIPDFADMSGEELQAELIQALKRAATGKTVLERSSGRIHAEVIERAIAEHGLRPKHRYLDKAGGKPRFRPYRPRGQYEKPV